MLLRTLSARPPSRLSGWNVRLVLPFTCHLVHHPFLFFPSSNSQTAAWIADGLLVDPVCQEVPRWHIFQLLCWRYSRLSVPDDIYSSDDEDGQNRPKVMGFSSSISYIDRAVWPAEYVHVENPMLHFKQPNEARRPTRRLLAGLIIFYRLPWILARMY